MKLMKSRNIVEICRGKDEIVIFNSLFGNARVIDLNSKAVLDYFVEYKEIESVFNEFNVNQREKDILKEIIDDFIEAKILIPEEVNEREQLKKDNNAYLAKLFEDFPFEFIGFNVTKRCNFACKYCVAEANLEYDKYDEFNKDKIQSYIYSFAEELIYNKKKYMGIGFTGGEPLIYWNELKAILNDTIEKYGNQLEIGIFMNTNASLVTEEIAKDFFDLKINPSLSIDGLREMNDSVRIQKNGKGTFDMLFSGITKLKENGVPCKSFYLTLTRDNFDFKPEEIVNFASNNGFEAFTIEPDLVHIVGLSIKEICDKITETYILGLENGIEVMGFWKRPFNNLFDYKENSNGFCRALDSKSVVISRQGFIEPCGYSDLKLTKFNSFSELRTDDKYMNFIESNLRGNIVECKGCEIEGLCKGGCLISRTKDINNKEIFEYRCNIYKEMTKRLLMIADFN